MFDDVALRGASAHSKQTLAGSHWRPRLHACLDLDRYMYCTHTNDEFIEYAALTIQAHTNDQPNCRRYAVSDRSILLEVETDLTGAH